MGSAIGYPFSLITRRPLGVFAGFLLYVLAAMGIDIGFAAAGVDVIALNPTDASQKGAFQVYNLVNGILGMLATAFFMGLALVDLGRRQRNASPGDGVQLIVLNLKFSFMVILPLGIGALISIGVASGAWGVVGASVAGVPWALALIYFAVRYSMAAPRALAHDDASLGKAWPLTKGRFWPLGGMLLLAQIIALGPLIGLGIVIEWFGLTPAPVFALEHALLPEVLLYSASYAVLAAFVQAYSGAALAALYAAIVPSDENVADVF